MIDRTNQSEQLPTGIARRRFLGQVAIGTTAFTIVPRHALGVSGHTPPSERLNIAGVGMGGQGTGLIQRFGDLFSLRPSNTSNELARTTTVRHREP